jgi:adenosylcobinamide-GDP ribazoletransferase
VKRFLIALQFLTIIPVRIRGRVEEKDLGGSLLYFPAVGLLLGALTASIAFCLAPLPPLVGSILILTVWVAITGAVHLDGLADTCDGFYAGKGRDDILRIMRDSRIGAMGVIGVCLVLLAKFALIASIPAACLWKALVMAAVFSRWSQALACLISGYARKEGKAGHFIGSARKKDIITGGLFTLTLFIALAGFKGVLVIAPAFIAGLLFVRYAGMRIGGMTGDVIGAYGNRSPVLRSDHFWLCIIPRRLSSCHIRRT